MISSAGSHVLYRQVGVTCYIVRWESRVKSSGGTWESRVI